MSKAELVFSIIGLALIVAIVIRFIYHVSKYGRIKICEYDDGDFVVCQYDSGWRQKSIESSLEDARIYIKEYLIIPKVIATHYYDDRPSTERLSELVELTKTAEGQELDMVLRELQTIAR